MVRSVDNKSFSNRIKISFKNQYALYYFAPLRNAASLRNENNTPNTHSNLVCLYTPRGRKSDPVQNAISVYHLTFQHVRQTTGHIVRVNEHQQIHSQ